MKGRHVKDALQRLLSKIALVDDTKTCESWTEVKFEIFLNEINGEKQYTFYTASKQDGP